MLRVSLRVENAIPELTDFEQTKRLKMAKTKLLVEIKYHRLEDEIISVHQQNLAGKCMNELALII